MVTDKEPQDKESSICGKLPNKVPRIKRTTSHHIRVGSTSVIAVTPTWRTRGL
jgi:hypothetical protein